MKLKIGKFSMEDELYEEDRVADYTVNISSVDEVLEVEIPDFFILKTLPNGKKCLYDINDCATKIKENEDGNLVIFSNGDYYPVKVI